MGKSLTFLSVFLGIILGYALMIISKFVVNVSSNSVWAVPSNPEYWYFAFIVLVAFACATGYFLIERHQSDKIEEAQNKLINAINALSSQLENKNKGKQNEQPREPFNSVL